LILVLISNIECFAAGDAGNPAGDPMFVTIDGLDGSGKTTLVAALAKKLKRQGCAVSIASFPGTTKLGKSVRRFLLDPVRNRDIPTETLLLLGNFREVYLQYRDRSHEVVMIADRFFTSTLGYQGAASDNTRNFVRAAVKLAFPEPIIDIRLILDVPYEIGRKRVASRRRKDRFDLVEREAFEKIRNEIMESASRDFPQAIILDNSGAFKETMSAAWDAVSHHSSYPGNR
jgi:dTMP kinase